MYLVDVLVHLLVCGFECGRLTWLVVLNLFWGCVVVGMPVCGIGFGFGALCCLLDLSFGFSGFSVLAFGLVFGCGFCECWCLGCCWLLDGLLVLWQFCGLGF